DLGKVKDKDMGAKEKSLKKNSMGGSMDEAMTKKRQGQTYGGIMIGGANGRGQMALSKGKAETMLVGN
ncbi:unnamed protein product, partial [Ilex paraguariensis]